MIITYLRSSALNSFEWCQAKYFYEYVLGLGSKANIQASKGNVCHKVLETLALYKYAIARNKETFDVPDIGQFKTDQSPDIKIHTRTAYEHYKGLAQHCDWSENDFDDCLKWVHTTLEWNDHQFDPLNCDIFGVEQYFDIVIPDEWAYYKFKTPEGKEIEGQLAIRGNIDFIIDRGSPNLEGLDWKYAATRNDWSKNNPIEKNYTELVNDRQLLLYYYAMKNIYKWADIQQTIFFVLAGGPITIPRGEEDYQAASNMLRNYFEKIKSVKTPQKNITWKCKKFCHFGKTLQPGTNETICEFMHSKCLEDGTHSVMREFGKKDNYLFYGEGGGKSAR